ncbi:hypothetical protein [Sphingomonas colocasiae]|nr:hypothetical protein [Sphingomonas colocasiae]
MTLRHRIRLFMASEPMRWTMLAIGWLFIAVTPLVGPIPGPGGVITFAIGAGLVLKNSRWAKRRYVRFKQRHPKWGSWSDWSLRRESAKRREAIARETSSESD